MNCCRYIVTAILLAVMSSPASAAYENYSVRYITGPESETRLPAEFQFVSMNWGGANYSKEIDSAVHPNMIYMPEKNRVLMLSVHGRKGTPALTYSDDGGNTWSAPQLPKTEPPFARIADAWSHSLSNLGGGKAVFQSAATMTPDSCYTLWYTEDFGETWRNPIACPKMSNGHKWANWDPMLADIDPKTGNIVRLTQTGFDVTGPEAGKSGVFIRFSNDTGKTWYQEILVPQWKGLNEINLQRARNGNLVAACRTDGPRRFQRWGFNDHCSGLVVSVSKDNGMTWSEPNVLYDWGRHHPSLVTLPDGTMVMTYVVRTGYCKSEDGTEQHGIEAVVSRDNGRTWDLDHKYILADWVGRFGDPTPQGTSSLALPDGSILTVFGTGHGSTRIKARRDAALVHWRLVDKHAKFGGPITSAYYDTKLRNEYDPAPKKNVKIAGKAKGGAVR